MQETLQTLYGCVDTSQTGKLTVTKYLYSATYLKVLQIRIVIFTDKEGVSGFSQNWSNDVSGKGL